MIRAYIIAAKTSGNNETTLDFSLGEIDKHLPQRGEWERLLDVYNALYDRNPDAPQALMYLNKRFSTRNVPPAPKAKSNTSRQSRIRRRFSRERF